VRIKINDRVILTISKTIVSKKSLTRRRVVICVNESAEFGVVIAGLEVIQGGFVVVCLATGAKQATFSARFDR
jgi:hypothetical protein